MKTHTGWNYYSQIFMQVNVTIVVFLYEEIEQSAVETPA